MRAIGSQQQRLLDLVDDVVDEEAVCFQPDRIDHRIGADPAGHLHQRFVSLGDGEIDGLGAELLRQLQPTREMIDRDYSFGAHQKCRLYREQPDRAAAPDRDDIATFDLGVLRCHPAGRQDIGQEQHLIVLDAVGDDDRPDIAERHPNIFGLPAGIATGHVAIAEQPATSAGHRAAAPMS